MYSAQNHVYNDIYNHQFSVKQPLKGDIESTPVKFLFLYTCISRTVTNSLTIVERSLFKTK